MYTNTILYSRYALKGGVYTNSFYCEGKKTLQNFLHLNCFATLCAQPLRPDWARNVSRVIASYSFTCLFYISFLDCASAWKRSQIEPSFIKFVNGWLDWIYSCARLVDAQSNFSNDVWSDIINDTLLNKLNASWIPLYGFCGLSNSTHCIARDMICQVSYWVHPVQFSLSHKSNKNTIACNGLRNRCFTSFVCVC